MSKSKMDKNVGRFNISSNDALEKIALQIDAHKQEYQSHLDNVKDVWTPLGRQAPLLRTVFNGVNLPIQNKNELIEALGGEDKVFIAPSLDGYMMAVTVKDLVANLDSFLEKGLEFPVIDWESLAHQIMKWEYKNRKSEDKKQRLLRNIDSKHLDTILGNEKKVRLLFPKQHQRKFSEEFELKRHNYESMLQKPDKGFLQLFSGMPFFSNDTFTIELIARLLEYLKEKNNEQQNANIVQAKISSANTHLNNAEQSINTASGYISNVLSANNLTSTVRNYNTLAQNLLDSANQLLAQAIADLAAAEAAAQVIPDNAEAQNAVAEAQAKLEGVQNQLSALILEMARAEAHKDVLSIPEVCITIRCIEEDPCCDDDWNGVNVCITNTSNADVPEVCGTTAGNGSVTLCGRFGNSSVVVRTTGSGGWNETRYFNIGSHGVSYTIKVDLAGWE